MSISRWFSVMKQSLVQKSFNGKLYLYCSTIPLLHWDALGARRLPCKVSVWTAWHTTLSKWGIFLEVSSFMCISFGHIFGNNDPVVFGVNFQLFFCPCNCLEFLCIWSYTCCKVFKHLTGFACICSSSWPFLIRAPRFHYLTPVRYCPLFFTISNNRWCWKFQRSQAKKYFFLPKKYMSIFPPILFSLLSSSRLLFLDCLTICCSECL